MRKQPGIYIEATEYIAMIQI